MHTTSHNSFPKGERHCQSTHETWFFFKKEKRKKTWLQQVKQMPDIGHPLWPAFVKQYRPGLNISACCNRVPFRKELLRTILITDKSFRKVKQRKRKSEALYPDLWRAKASPISKSKCIAAFIVYQLRFRLWVSTKLATKAKYDNNQLASFWLSCNQLEATWCWTTINLCS